MKPERAQELYTDYAEGTLSPAMKLALEQHFEADPSARADYDKFYGVWSLLESPMGDVEVPLGFRAAIMERVTKEQSKRSESPFQNFLHSLTGWFDYSPQRRTAGALAVTVVAATVIGVFSHPTGSLTGSLSPGINSPIAMDDMTGLGAIQSVTTQPGQDGNVYHMFHIHLPHSISHATVNAYVIKDTSEITNPDLLAHDATPALKQPHDLHNDEEMQIPVALLSSLPAGSTLNMLVQWTAADDANKSGAQVIFAPDTAGQSNTAAISATSVGFYDALQSIAAADGVTVIADAKNAPTQAVTVNPAIPDPQAALKSVADSVGFGVKTIDDHTYQVYQKHS